MSALGMQKTNLKAYATAAGSLDLYLWLGEGGTLDFFGVISWVRSCLVFFYMAFFLGAPPPDPHLVGLRPP